jgi:hypothetical protein
MPADPPDNDLDEIAGQLSALTGDQTAQVPELRGPLAALASSVSAIARAIAAPEGDAAARTRLADELDRTRERTLEATRAAAEVNSRTPTDARARLPEAQLAAMLNALELVASWLRAPTAENTAGVERLVAAFRAIPGFEEAMWHDQAADAKRKAELDTSVQKSLDEIAAGMPKFKL